MADHPVTHNLDHAAAFILDPRSHRRHLVSMGRPSGHMMPGMIQPEVLSALDKLPWQVVSVRLLS